MKKTTTTIITLLFLLCATTQSLAAPNYPAYEKLPALRQQHAITHFKRILNQPVAEPFKFALAAFYLNERVDEANTAIINEINNLRHSSADGLKKKLNGKTQEPHLDLSQPNQTQLQPDVAGSEYIKWKSRTIARIYFLFNSKSAHFPGRLSPAAEEQLHQLFFAFAQKKSVIARLSNVWINNSSENHEMMATANAYLYIQILSNLPHYANRKLTDGHTITQHHKAWINYFNTYCLERARWGLFWEVYSPTYGKYFLPDIYNLHDFTKNPQLKSNTANLISLLWADWSSNQLHGVTGGAKTRNYLDSYLTNARSDSYFNLSRMQLALPDGVDMADKTFVKHAAHNTALQPAGIMYTSAYRLPKIVYDLMTQKDPKGSFTYRSIRPAREFPHPKNFDTSIYEEPAKVRIMHAQDSKVIKYTWHTPHYLMGTFLLSPLIEYEAGPQQNRFCSIIFDSKENARIVPVCRANPPAKTKHYRQHIYIQHENVMIVAKNTHNSKDATASRVYFSDGMKDRLIPHQDWLIIEEGQSYAAVKTAPYSGATQNTTTWIDKNLLELSTDSTPIIIVGSDRTTHPTLNHFKTYLNTHTLKINNANQLDYTFTNKQGAATQLTLFKDVTKLPHLNNAPVQLSPNYTFDSPYLYSPNGSGLATLTYNNQNKILDFTQGQTLAIPIPPGNQTKNLQLNIPTPGAYRLFLKSSQPATSSQGPVLTLNNKNYQTTSNAQDQSWYYTIYNKNKVTEFNLPAGNLQLKITGQNTDTLQYLFLVPFLNE